MTVSVVYVLKHLGITTFAKTVLNNTKKWFILSYATIYVPTLRFVGKDGGCGR